MDKKVFINVCDASFIRKSAIVAVMAQEPISQDAKWTLVINYRVGAASCTLNIAFESKEKLEEWGQKIHAELQEE